MKTKHEKMNAEFDHDWNDISVFEKLPVRKTAGKRNDWKRDRKAARKAKQSMQEKNYA